MGLTAQDALVWNGNWAWSLPLIVLTVIFHVVSMVFITEGVVLATRWVKIRRNFNLLFAFLMGSATLLATLLHAIEATVWSGLYLVLGALPDGKSALLYSLSAMTTYGHERFDLADHWQLMGSLEALDGMILFGLTTAFLYGMIRTLLAERSPNA
jgi:hypothetical protein